MGRWSRWGALVVTVAAGLVALACSTARAPTPSAPPTGQATPFQEARTTPPATSTQPPPTPSFDPRSRFAAYGYVWKTDFSRHTVPLEEVKYLGLERDQIFPIYHPAVETIAEGNQWLLELEPVIVVEVNDEARAYSQSVLVAREIVNDVLGGKPIAVTW
ncbi:MAG: DUF3179 domain-containing protein [Chloroflexi bacterium]|nr:DUF3179 domain-containing protein [Chloroflexota bacterium]